MKHVVTSREGILGSSRDRLRRVEAHHSELDARLRVLARQSYLTPSEQRELIELKKHKLRAKDEIATLRR